MTEYFCSCSASKCNTVLDARTGQMGVWLDSRRYNDHQSRDQRKAATFSLEERQTKALRAAEIHLEDAIGNRSHDELPPGLNPSLPKRQGQYKADRSASWVLAFSKIIDDLNEIRKKAEIEIGFGSHSSSADIVDTKISQCTIKHEEWNNIMARLEALTQSLGRSKDPSALETQSAARKEAQMVKIQVKAYETSWRQVVEERAKAHQARLDAGITEHDTKAHFTNQLKDVKPVIQLVMAMAVVAHILLALPRRGCTWIFTVCKAVIILLLQPFVGDQLPPYLESMIHGFPRDIRIVEEVFNLEPRSTIYAACPACNYTHKPTFEAGIPIYPYRCEATKYGSHSRCGTILLRPKQIGSSTAKVPIKPFVTFDFNDWLAALLSRPGYESLMDGAWSKMEPERGVIRDIFQASVVREFMGPVKNVHFSAAGGEGAGRYLFSLGCDFFNPRGNHVGGKKTSVGAISLICLNLPIHLRYRVENIFLAGIIPGPREPRTDEINHYLRPLVDILICFWTGVWFTQTHAYELGRLVLCAIIAIVCDLPAARKVGGYAGHNHHRFCTVCCCNKNTASTQPESTHLRGYNNYDIASWEIRSSHDWRKHAETYKAAPDSDTARNQFDKTGIRWSELLRLPYYDPVRFLVVDPMHNLFLGLIHEHFRRILGYGSKAQKNRTHGVSNSARSTLGALPDIPFKLHPTNHLPTKETELQSIDKLRSWLKQPLAGINRDELIKRLSKAHVASLVYVGRGIGCISDAVTPEGRDSADQYKKKLSKLSLATLIADWRISQLQPGDSFGVVNADAAAETSPSFPHGSVFTTEEMVEIWADLKNFIKPSWVVTIPQTFLTQGSHSLKSDEWRAIGTLYLPASLIRLWNKTNDSDHQASSPESIFRKKCLELTMSLASAVIIATSQAITSHHGDEYLFYMTQYRQQLHQLFPDYSAKCNHHMAMHLPMFLDQYGPVHGWWTFPTERMNGMLQRIESNYKEGEYEETIATKWHRSTALRAFFSQATCPEALLCIKNDFLNLFKPQSSNALAENSRAEDSPYWNLEDQSDDDEYQNDGDSNFESLGFTQHEHRLPDEWVTALAERGCGLPNKSASTAPYIRFQGRVFAINTKHHGNSGVITRHGQSTAPGQIEGIVQVPSGQVWLLIRHFKDAGIQDDPFVKFPVLRAKLWSAEPANDVAAVALKELRSHCARLPINLDGKDMVMVVSLLRVSIEHLSG